MLVAIAACTKTDIKPNDDLANALNPSSGAPIALASQDASPKADGVTDVDAFNAVRAGGFKVWSWFQGTTAGAMFGENGTIVTDVNYVADLPEGQTQPAPNWTYSPVRYWLNGTYDFAAVYPSTASGTYRPAENSTTPVLTVENFDVTNQDDLLVAFNTGIDGSKGSENGPVDLTFQHALSCVQLKLSLDEDDFFEPAEDGGKRQVGYAYVSIVGFNNIATTGSLYATKTTASSIVWGSYGPMDTNDPSKPVGQMRLNYTDNPLQVTLQEQYVFGNSGHLVLPQQFISDNAELYMQVIIYPLGHAGEKITKEYHIPLSSGVPEWEPNKKYIYTGVLTQELVIDFSVTQFNFLYN